MLATGGCEGKKLLTQMNDAFISVASVEVFLSSGTLSIRDDDWLFGNGVVQKMPQ